MLFVKKWLQSVVETYISLQVIVQLEQLLAKQGKGQYNGGKLPVWNISRLFMG